MPAGRGSARQPELIIRRMNMDPETKETGEQESGSSQKEQAQANPEELDNVTFQNIKDFVYGKCGITLGDKKKPLVSARIRKRMRALSIKSPKEYFEYIMDDPTGMEIVMLLDSISTNVTAFFREPAHLDFLREKTAEWLKKGQARFRFWSAACSSGEEPYSMSFVINDALEESGKTADIKILASDISTKVLGQAHQGMYEEQKVLSVPEASREKYMDKISGPKRINYMVKQQVKDMLVIKRINLTEMPFPMKGPMDMIFCRNVMIYFDKELRKKLVGEFFRLVKPGGYLIVGHTESLIDINVKFKRLGPSIYVKHGE